MLLDQTVFELTEKGRNGLASGIGLAGDAKIILPLFGNGLTVTEVAERLPPSVRACCVGTVRNLLADGYIVAAADVAEVGLPEPSDAPAIPPPAEQAGVTVVDDDGLDFTGKFHTPDASPVPEEEQTMRLISKAKLAEEIEVRAQQLIREKYRHMELEMSNTMAELAEHESRRQEQEALARECKMVESARLSPLFDGLRVSPFFVDFSDAQLAEALHIGVWHEADEHQTLIKQGDVATSFYVMLKGLAGVFKRERLIGLVQPGDSFGEFSMLAREGDAHHAEVVTRSCVEYMEFGVDQLQDVSLGAQLRFASAFSRCQTKRLMAANEQIANLLSSDN